MYIGVIAESDYPAFREICDGREFPTNYDAYRKRIEGRKESYRARGFIPRELNVDFLGFERHRWSTKRATFRELDRYAARLVYRKHKRK
jgi:hypothetical protein